jgi:hypothetical protein
MLGCSLIFITEIRTTFSRHSFRRVVHCNDLYGFASAKVNNHTVFCYIFLLLLYPSIYHWASRDKVGASVGSYHRERRRCAWWPWWSWNIDFFIFKICKIISQFNVWKRVQITVYCILCYSTLLVYTSTVSIYSVPVITNYNNSSPYVRRTTS